MSFKLGGSAQRFTRLRLDRRPEGWIARRATSLLAFAALALLPIALAATTPATASPASGSFSPTGSMAQARTGHTGTLLPNGDVLVAGGFGPLGGGYIGFLENAELYKPASGTFTATGSMTVARSGHTATLLQDGRVLVAGGEGPCFICWRNSSELYDPSGGSFSSTGLLNVARGRHTATLLENGKVLIVGGLAGFTPTASAELYDPLTGSFAFTGSLVTARFGHTATRLPNGKVLVAGGSTALGTFSTATAELYDPATGSFSPTASMTIARNGHSATLLTNGKVLIVGGFSGADPVASAELYNPATGTFTATGSMVATREGHAATPLGNGSVLVAGGETISGGSYIGLASAEVYDAASGSFSPAGDMSIERRGHVATRLASGNALVVGGAGDAGTTAEIFSVDTTPPDLTVSVTPSLLWPPTHKYVTVTATVTATDNSGTSPTVELVSVTSNEPDNGLGDGDTPSDIVINPNGAYSYPDTFQLRAERSGTGTGRIYTITYRATDASENSATAVATVTVPLSQK